MYRNRVYLYFRHTHGVFELVGCFSVFRLCLHSSSSRSVGSPRPSCLLSEDGAWGLAQSWPPTLAPQGWTLPRLVGEDSRTWQATVENIHSQAKVLKHCQRITGSLKWQELSQGTTMALGFYFVSGILWGLRKAVASVSRALTKQIHIKGELLSLCGIQVSRDFKTGDSV